MRGYRMLRHKWSIFVMSPPPKAWGSQQKRYRSCVRARGSRWIQENSVFLDTVQKLYIGTHNNWMAWDLCKPKIDKYRIGDFVPGLCQWSKYPPLTNSLGNLRLCDRHQEGRGKSEHSWTILHFSYWNLSQKGARVPITWGSLLKCRYSDDES